MVAPAVLLAAATAATTLGTGAGIFFQAKAQGEAERADDVRRAQAEQENQRNIRQAIAQSRLAQAQQQVAAQAQGANRSSSVAGALGAADTQLAANVGFANQTQAANVAVNRATSRANRFMSNASIGQQIAGLPNAFGLDSASIWENYVKNKDKPDAGPTAQ